jgi:TRAP transporter TAXI family solute receptor
MGRFLVAMLTLVALAGPGRPQEPPQALQLFTVGSGDLGGGYYDAARALCGVLNRGARGVLRCSPEPTAGTLYNLSMLHQGQLDLALAQSDWQQAAVEGTGPFAGGGPMPEMRSVMALYPEMITVLAGRDSEIFTALDLPGKRIDIGQPGSGRNASLRRLMTVLGFEVTHFARLAELPTATAFQEVCNGRLDAAVLVVGHPNEGVEGMLAHCGARLVPFQGPRISAALAEMPALERAVIGASTYPQLTEDVPTLATMATVVTTDAVPIATIEAFVRAALDHLPELAIRAPILGDLEPGTMATVGLSAPLHPGALAAFAAD